MQSLVLLLCHYTLLFYLFLIIFASFCYCVIIHYCITLSWSYSLVFVIMSLYNTVLLYIDYIHNFLLLCHYTLLYYFILILFTSFCYCVIMLYCPTLSWSYLLVFFFTFVALYIIAFVPLYFTVLGYLDHIHWILLLCNYTLLSYIMDHLGTSCDKHASQVFQRLLARAAISACLPVYLPACRSACLPAYLAACL